MGYCSQRRPGSDLSPYPVPDIKALTLPPNTSVRSYCASEHLSALLSLPYPPPDRLQDNGVEELQIRRSCSKSTGNRDLSLPVLKISCASCGNFADGYCIQCRLRRYCQTCFVGEHSPGIKHTYMKYASYREANKQLLLNDYRLLTALQRRKQRSEVIDDLPFVFIA
jgi:hypothetical protein